MEDPTLCTTKVNVTSPALMPKTSEKGQKKSRIVSLQLWIARSGRGEGIPPAPWGWSVYALNVSCFPLFPHALPSPLL